MREREKIEQKNESAKLHWIFTPVCSQGCHYGHNSNGISEDHLRSLEEGTHVTTARWPYLHVGVWVIYINHFSLLFLELAKKNRKFV